jgi:magnesium transporter
MTSSDPPENMESLQAEFDYNKVLEQCQELHPASSADLLKEFSIEKIREVLIALNKESAAVIFGHFSEELQLAVALDLEDHQLAQLVTNMSNDERVDFFQNLPDDRQVKIFRLLARSEREDILRLASHEEGTAGAVMTSEYVALPLNLTAEQAINYLRREASSKETIYASYVLDTNRRLLGVVSLTDLILSPANQSLTDIMTTEVIRVEASEHQEEAATRLAKFDLIAIPVVDAHERLVGIITADDVIDIIQEEHTQDVEKLMAITGAGGPHPYLETSSWWHFKRRSTWVVSLAGVGLVAGWILHSQGSILEKYLILALYMPMMTDTGGNVGTQATAVVIRSLSLQQISFKDTFRVLFKEFKVSLYLSVVLATLAFLKVFWLSSAAEVPAGTTLVQIAFVISSALALQVIISTTIGAALPLVASRMKLDPAVIAAPALTTIVDIIGLIIYFAIARFFLLGG